MYLCIKLIQISQVISYEMVRAPDNFLVDGVISPYLLEIGVFHFFSCLLIQTLNQEYI